MAGTESIATPQAEERAALAVARGICRLFARNDIWCLPEMPLRSGRRADLMGIDAKGQVVIVEIKVSRADLLRALLSREKSEGGATKSDDELRRDITKVVEGQPWSSAWPTNVVVSQGVAHLWGFVQSEAARKAYRVAAENVPGVKAVKNHMRMPPSSVNMGV